MICRTASPREASPLACVLFSLSAACAGFSASRAAKKRHHFTRSLLAKLASVCLLAGFGAVTTAAQSPQMASSGGVTAPFSVTRVYGGGTSYATSTPMAVTSWRGTYANQVITDSAGNIYISEYLGGNFCNVYEIVAATQKVMVIAGGGGALATTTPANGTSVVLVPYSLAIDGSGNLYIADYGLGFIEKMTGLNGSGTPQIKVIAGGGASYPTSTPAAGTAVSFAAPGTVMLDSSGNLYVTDGTNGIDKITNPSTSPQVMLLGGTGSTTPTTTPIALTAAKLLFPAHGVFDAAGNIYLSDTSAQKVYEITALSGTPQIHLVAGGGATAVSTLAEAATSAKFVNPAGLVFDGSGNLFLADADYQATGSDIDEITGLGTATPQIVQVIGSTGVAADTTTRSIATISSQGAYAIYADANGYLNYNDEYLNYNRTSINLKSAPTTFTGTTAVGSTSSTLNVLVKLTSATALSSISASVTANGLSDFTLGTVTGCTIPGTSTQNTAGLVCTVPVTFTPQYSGLRSGTITLYSAGTTVFGTVGVTGIATGPQLTYPPTATLSSATSLLNIGSGFSQANGLAIDAAGNLYVGDLSPAKLYEIQAVNGVIPASPTISTLGGGFAGIWGTAVDAAGNVYVADASTVKEVPPGCVTSTCVVTLGGGFASPGSIAVDTAGNVYVGDYATNGFYEMSPNCTAANVTICKKSLGGFFLTPFAAAVDTSGNVYVGDQGTGHIYQMTPNCTSSACRTQLGGSTLISPGGLAVDANGNVYYSDDNNGSINEMTPNCTSSACITELAVYQALNTPFGIALDSKGNVFIADQLFTTLKELDLSDIPSLTFPTTTNGGSTDSTDGAKLVKLKDYGNSVLTIAVPTVGQNPSVGADFTYGVGSGTCPQLSTISSASTLAANASCNFSITFSPLLATAGTASESVVLTDNNLNVTSATQTVSLTGTASTPAPTVTSVTPFSDYTPGGNPIAIVGTHFTGATAVNFGSTAATSFTINSATSITATDPAGSIGTVNVTVTTPAGTSALGAGDQFIYYGTQTITFTQPTTPYALGGGTVTLSATGGSSGNPVVFTVDGSSTATGSIVGNILIITSTGTLVIDANQAGGANYAAATQVQKSIVVTVPASYTSPTTAVGSTSATQTAYVTFTTAGTPSSISVVTQGVTGLDFNLVSGGTCSTSTAYTIGQSCTVLYSFTPGAPGQRLGAIVLTSSTPAVLGMGYLTGTGTGALAGFTPGTISTVAGNGTAGYTGDTGPATSAELRTPQGGTVDAAGNIYIAEYSNDRIRKVTAATGIITTVAGNGSGGYNGDNIAATSAQLSNPYGVAVDGAGNLYIVDNGNDRIRKVTAATGIITTVAGNGTFGYAGDNGAATSAKLNTPQGVAVDGAGNVYIADAFNERIRMVTATTGIITTVAGTGTAGYVPAQDGGAATSAELGQPVGVTVDGAGNLYIADTYNHRIRKVTAATGIITTVAGNGTAGYVAAQDGGAATSAELHNPAQVAVDGAGNLYIADQSNSRIRKVAAATGIITTVAGNGTAGYVAAQDGGAATSAELNYPGGVAVDGAGNLYIEDIFNQRIRMVTAAANPLAFTSTNDGSTSAVQSVTVTNNGNTALTATSTGLAVSANYTQVAGSGTPADCTTNFSLASGASCNISLEFAPVSPASGTVTGTTVLTDNNTATTGLFSGNSVSPTQTIALSGTAVLSTSKLAFGTAPTVSLVPGGNGGTAITVLEENASSATVTSATDAITLTVTGPAGFTTTVYGPTNAVAGIATFNVSAAALTIPGTYTYTATFGTLTSAVATETVVSLTTTTVTSSANPQNVLNTTYSLPGTVTFTATVTPSASAPTGTVTFKDGASNLGTGTLSLVSGNYVATYTTTALTQGSHSITAVYAGNSSLAASTSSVLPQIMSGTPATIAITSGNNQTTAIGQPFALPITFLITDSLGNPVPGGQVGLAGFSADNFTFAGGVSQATANSSGVAVSAVITAGPVPGTYIATAYSSTSSASINVTLNVTAPSTYTAPTTAVGATSSTQTAYVTITTAGTLGSITVSTQGATGLDFAYVSGQTCSIGTAYTVGQTCAVFYTFRPMHPGQRLGAITLTTSGGTLLGNSFLNGTGTGPQISYGPGVKSIIGSGWGNAAGVAVDASGNVYVVDQSHNLVWKETPSGSSYTASIVADSTSNYGLSYPTDVAVDGAGNVYITDQNNSRIVKETLVGGSYVQSVVANSGPYALTVDGSGNIYFPNGSNVVMETLQPNGSYVQSTIGSGMNIGYGSVKVDSSGNLYIGDQYDQKVVKETLSGGSYTPSVIATGFQWGNSIALDAAGDVYVADQGTGKLYKETPSGSSYTQSTLATTLNGPIFMNIDGSGNLYIGNNGADQFIKLNLSDAPTLTFASTNDGSTAAAQSVTITNNGNAALTAASTGLAVSANYTQVAGSGTPVDCSTTFSLAAGASCNLSLEFAPVSPASGTTTGTTVLTDNNLNVSSATQTINLTGTAVLGLTAQSITFTPASPITYSVSPITLTATGGGSGNPVTFSILSGPGTLSGTNNATLTLTGVGAIQIAANQAGNGSYLAAPQVTHGIFVSAASSYTAPTSAVGTTSATQTAYVTITTAGTLNTISVLTQGATGLDFNIVSGGSCSTSTAYSVSQTCSVFYTFKPGHPGQRVGGIALFDSSGKLLSNTYLNGIGTGPQIAYSPGAVNTLGSGFGTPYATAVDGNGDVFVADQNSGSIKEMVAVSGVIPASPTIKTIASGISAPSGVAVDGSGNVYYSDGNNAVVKEVVAVGGVIPASPTIRSLSTSFNGPYGLAVDSLGDVFVADYNGSAVREIEAVNGVIPASPTVTTLGSGFSGPRGVAVDASGNVFVADSGNGAIKEMVAVSGVIPASPTINTLSSGFNFPLGVAVDSNGNVYVDDTVNRVLKEIVAVSGVIPASPTILTLASGFTAGALISLDGSGNVYIADFSTNLVSEYNVSTAPSLTYASTNDGSTTAAQSFTITNNGNAALNAVSPGLAVSSNYTQVAGSGTPADCTSSFSLAANASCNISLEFAPVAPASGTTTGTVVLTDNNLNVTPSTTQTINLTGTAVLPTPTVTAVSPANGSSAGGTSVTITGTNLSSATAVKFGAVSGTITANTATSITVTSPAGSVSTVDVTVTTLGGTSATSAADKFSYLTAQTISFTQPTTPYVLHSGTVALTATGGASSNAVVFTIDGTSTGAGSISGTTLTVTGAGNLILDANQAGNSTYAAATQVQRTIVVSAFGTATQLVITSPFAPIALGSTFGSLTAAYEDVYGNVVTTQTTTTFVDVTNGTGYSQTPSVAAVNGVATISYSSIAAPTTPGVYTVSVAAGVGGITQASGSVIVAASSYTANTRAVASPGADTAYILFANSFTLGSISVVTQGATGLDYVNNSTGTCTVGTTYAAGSACSVGYNFGPLHPGTRYGAILIYDNSTTPVLKSTILLNGIGTGPQITYTPGVQSTIGSGWGNVVGVTVDASGNVYVVDQSHKQVWKETPSGSSYTASIVADSTSNYGLSYPTDVAVDGAGNVYITDQNNSRVVKETLVGGSYVQSVVVNSGPYALTVDGSGNIYFPNGGNVVKETLQPNGSYVQSTIGGGMNIGYGSVRVDGSGNLFIGDQYDSQLVKETLSGGSYTQSVIANGFQWGVGVAVDAAGDVFVADAGTAKLYKETPSGSSYTQSLLTATLSSPLFMSIDGNGNLYVGNNGTQKFLKLDMSDAPTLTFASTNDGSTSAAQSISISNNGNAALTAASTGLAVSANYTQIAGSGTPADCTTTFSLAAGASCNISLEFAPTGSASGSTPGTTVLTDNNLNATPSTTQTINLTGTAVISTSKLAFGTAPATPITAGGNGGSAITVLEENSSSATVTTATDSITLTVTGPVGFTTAVYGPTAAVAGIATFNVSGAALAIPGTYTYTATFGSLTSAAATETVAAPTITVSPSTLPTPAISSAYSQTVSASGGTSPYSFSVTLGSLPTGLVLNTTSGVVSGTPTAVGTFNFTIKATDSSAAGPFTGTQAYSVTIAAPTLSALPTNPPAPTVGAAYSQTFTPSGGTAPYTYSISAGALPSGLTLSSSGILSGTATSGGPYSFTIKIADSSTGTGAPYSVSQPFTFTVTAPTITVSPSTVPAATVASTYTQSFTAAGGTAPYSFSTISPLPAGMTLSTAGVLSGKPTAAGTFSIAVKATDSTTGAGPYNGTTTVSLTVNAPTVVVSPSTVPAATVGVAYSQTLSASGGTAPYTLNMTTGTLPNGITFSAATGLLSGTPTAGGSFSFTVKGTDSSTGTGSPFSGSQAYTLTVNAAVITVSQSTLPAPTVGVAYSQSVAASGGTSPYLYNILTGSLPAGLSLNASTGAITGTATAGGSFSFTIKVTDSSTGTGAPYSVSQAYTFTAAAPTIVVSPTTLPAAAIASAYSQTVSASGGTAPYTFTISAGALPAGLSLSSAGVISGTPTAAGSFSYTVKGTDSSTGSGPYNGIQVFTLTVNAPTLTLLPATIPVAVDGIAYSQQFTASGGTAPYTYSLSSGTLPAGITLSTNGLLSGTTTVSPAPFSITVKAADSSTGTGAPFSKSLGYTLTVNPAAPIAGAVTQSVLVNSTNDQIALSLSGGAAVSVAVASAASHGTATASGTVIAYTPSSSYVGSDSFTYTATNITGTSAAATVTISVGKIPVTVTLGNLSPTYTATAQAATSTTVITSSSTPVTVAGNSYTYNGSSTAPTLAGTYPVVVTVVDPIYIGTATGTMIIGKAPATVSASPVARSYGVANPASFASSSTGFITADGITTSASVTAITTSAPGAYPIAVTIADPNSKLSNYSVSNNGGTLTITQAATAISLTQTSPTTSGVGTGIATTFTAVVTDATLNSTGTPTGTVQFLDGTTSLGTGTLNAAGVTTFTTTFTTATTHTISAVYLGDTNFSGNASAAFNEVVSVPAFTVTANPSAMTIQRGTSGIATLTFTPVGNYQGTVTLSCVGLPQFSSCIFTPSGIAFAGNNAVQTATVQFYTLNVNGTTGVSKQGVLWLPAIALLGFIAVRRRKLMQNLRPLLMLAIAAVALTAMTGCGSGAHFITPTGADTVTITAAATATAGASSQNSTQTAVITITITQ